MVSRVQGLFGVSAMMLPPLSAPPGSEHHGLRGCGASQAPEPHLATFVSRCPFPQPVSSAPSSPRPSGCSFLSPAFPKVSTSAWCSDLCGLRAAALCSGLGTSLHVACHRALPLSIPWGVSLCVVYPLFPRPEVKAAFPGFGVSEPAR